MCHRRKMLQILHDLPLVGLVETEETVVCKELPKKLAGGLIAPFAQPGHIDVIHEDRASALVRGAVNTALSLFCRAFDGALQL